MEFLCQNWGGVRWSSWIPFVGGNVQLLTQAPEVPRSRAITGNELFYIGLAFREAVELVLESMEFCAGHFPQAYKSFSRKKC